MKRRHFGTGIVCVVLIIAAAEAPAALLSYEGFDYAGTVLDGLDGGTGWGGAWLDSDMDFAYLTDDDVSLSSSAFPFAPTGDRLRGPALPDPPPGGSSEGVRALGTTASLADEGTVWYMSALMKKGGTAQTASENVEFSMTSVTTSTTQRIRWGMTSDGTDGDKFFVDIGDSPTTPGSRTVLAGVTYFLVARLTTHATDPDALSLWGYGPDDTVPASEPDTALADANVQFASNAALGALRLVTGNNNHQPEIDELRIGGTWVDVAVPEPAGLMIGLAGAGLLLARRRRSR